MKKYSSYSLIEIGLWLRHLRDAENLTMKSVRSGNDVILRELENFRFNVSISGSIILANFMSSLNEVDDEERLGSARAKELEDIIGTLEEIIFAESRTKFHYVTSERRYNLEFLVESPDRLFSDGVFELLPEISRYDFKEGFKCVAYETPTAAAFHMLRATEGVLKELYFSFIKQKRVKTPMWGNMLSQLEKKTRNKPSSALLEALDNIRKSYRNPTNHPEAIYTISQTEDLMGLCIDVVNKMHVAIQKNA